MPNAKRINFEPLWAGMTMTTTRQGLRQLLEETQGAPLCNGTTHDVKHEHLGVGVYKVWLEKRP